MVLLENCLLYDLDEVVRWVEEEGFGHQVTEKMMECRRISKMYSECKG